MSTNSTNPTTIPTHTPSKPYRYQTNYEFRPGDRVRALETGREWVVEARLWNHDPDIEAPGIEDLRQYILQGSDDPDSERRESERDLLDPDRFERVPADEANEDGGSA